MKLKHKIYKLIDISGLQLFDPIARLLFKEEPKVQIKRITQFIIIPAVTFCMFLLMWQIMAPRHTTKSGEVPTPIRVVDAARGIWTFHKREKQKSEAFITTPGDSKKLIESSNERLNEIETKLIPAQEELINKLKAEESIWKDKNINPKIVNFSKSESAIKEKEKLIEKELDELALSIGINEKDKKDLLLKKLKE